MYKLKVKKGEVLRIKDDKRTGITVTLRHGKEYPQELLKRIYDAGFTNFVTKSKPKKQEDEGAKEQPSD